MTLKEKQPSAIESADLDPMAEFRERAELSGRLLSSLPSGWAAMLCLFNLR